MRTLWLSLILSKSGRGVCVIRDQSKGSSVITGLLDPEAGKSHRLLHLRVFVDVGIDIGISCIHGN
jgi:hypothetical protein